MSWPRLLMRCLMAAATTWCLIAPLLAEEPKVASAHRSAPGGEHEPAAKQEGHTTKTPTTEKTRHDRQFGNTGRPWDKTRC